MIYDEQKKDATMQLVIQEFASRVALVLQDIMYLLISEVIDSLNPFI